MADTGVVDLNADLVGLWRGNLNILDGEGLASTPGDGSLLQLSMGVLDVLCHGILFSEPLAGAVSGNPYFASDGLEETVVKLVSAAMQTRDSLPKNQAHNSTGKGCSPFQQCLPWCTSCSEIGTGKGRSEGQAGGLVGEGEQGGDMSDGEISRRLG